MTWVVRGNLSAEEAQKIVTDVDSRRRIEDWMTMDDIVSSTAADSRFNAVLNVNVLSGGGTGYDALRCIRRYFPYCCCGHSKTA